MKSIKANRRNARLLALEGHDVAHIASVLKKDPARVAKWLRVFPKANIKAPRRGGCENRALVARMALERPDFLDVAVGTDLLGDSDLGVGFWDPLAVDFSDLVDETVEIIRRFPGVDRCERQDKEFIGVYGSAIDRVQLESALVKWWRTRLEGIN